MLPGPCLSSASSAEMPYMCASRQAPTVPARPRPPQLQIQGGQHKQLVGFSEKFSGSAHALGHAVEADSAI